ncbi:MAG TPA: hypothetical protein VMX75_00030 [Spirochaetia bacterium]|nr:hypothetical protein [Spirochaetia bacterium]
MGIRLFFNLDLSRELVNTKVDRVETGGLRIEILSTWGRPNGEVSELGVYP